MSKKQLFSRHSLSIPALVAILIIVASQFIPPFAGVVPSTFSSSTAVAQTTTMPMVAAGGDHTVGLKSDGTVVAVGSNFGGQCNVSSWTGITQVSARGPQTVGLKSDGTVVALGYNQWGECNVSSWTGITQVAAGNLNTVGLKADGTVVAVGSSYFGQCDVSSWTGITQVAAGGYHTVGLKSDGTVVAAGRDEYGQCNVSSWTGITQVAADPYHTVGLKSDGTVVAVGYNEYGCDVSSWTGITQVAVGIVYTVGLKSDGTVVTVGADPYGACNVSSWTGITQVAAGGKDTVGLKSDGTVVAVGNNATGQCNVSDWNLGTTPLPALAYLVPNSGEQGQTLTGVLVNGTNLSGATALTFSGTGVTASNLSVNGAGTQITADIIVTDSAEAGARDVTVTTPLGTSAALVGGFTVTGIRIVHPQGGDTWIIGETQSIQWTYYGVTGNINIYLSRDAGTTWEPIASGTPNDKNEDWVVVPPKTTLARIKITSVSDPNIVDTTSANFMILSDNSKPTLYNFKIEGDNLKELNGFERLKKEQKAYDNADPSYQKLLYTGYGDKLHVLDSGDLKGLDNYTQLGHYNSSPGECVSAVLALSYTEPALSDTDPNAKIAIVTNWVKGNNVMNGHVKPGTIIATFFAEDGGKYEGHVAIFKRYLPDFSGFELWDQNWHWSRVFGKHDITRDGTETVTNADKYYVVMVE